MPNPRIVSPRLRDLVKRLWKEEWNDAFESPERMLGYLRRSGLLSIKQVAEANIDAWKGKDEVPFDFFKSVQEKSKDIMKNGHEMYITKKRPHQVDSADSDEAEGAPASARSSASAGASHKRGRVPQPEAEAEGGQVKREGSASPDNFLWDAKSSQKTFEVHFQWDAKSSSALKPKWRDYFPEVQKELIKAYNKDRSGQVRDWTDRQQSGHRWLAVRHRF